MGLEDILDCKIDHELFVIRDCVCVGSMIVTLSIMPADQLVGVTATLCRDFHVVHLNFDFRYLGSSHDYDRMMLSRGALYSPHVD